MTNGLECTESLLGLGTGQAKSPRPHLPRADGGRLTMPDEGGDNAADAAIRAGEGDSAATPNTDSVESTDADTGTRERPADGGVQEQRRNPPRRDPPMSPAVAMAVQQVRNALAMGNVESALELLPVVEQLGGRRSTATRTLRRELARAVDRRVHQYISRGECRRAQALYARAQRVGAHGRAARHFGPRSCPSPRERRRL